MYISPPGKERKAFNIESPITKMPFGKHKGELLWTLGFNTIDWMRKNFLLTDRSKATFDTCLVMAAHEGAFAVLRRFPKDQWYVKLMEIYPNRQEADRACQDTKDYRDFVYPIITPTT